MHIPHKASITKDIKICYDDIWLIYMYYPALYSSLGHSVYSLFTFMMTWKLGCDDFICNIVHSLMW